MRFSILSVSAGLTDTHLKSFMRARSPVRCSRRRYRVILSPIMNESFAKGIEQAHRPFTCRRRCLQPKHSYFSQPFSPWTIVRRSTKIVYVYNEPKR